MLVLFVLVHHLVTAADHIPHRPVNGRIVAGKAVGHAEREIKALTLLLNQSLEAAAGLLEVLGLGF